MNAIYLTLSLQMRKLLEPSHRPSKYRKVDEDGAKASQTGPGGEKKVPSTLLTDNDFVTLWVEPH